MMTKGVSWLAVSPLPELGVDVSPRQYVLLIGALEVLGATSVILGSLSGNEFMASMGGLLLIALMAGAAYTDLNIAQGVPAVPTVLCALLTVRVFVLGGGLSGKVKTN